MPRARFIHPGITTDSIFAAFPRDARLFFVYVLTVADDAGNFPDDAAELKAKLFPHDDDIRTPDIIEFLHLFAERTLYLRYTLGERTWYHIKNFAKYQRPDYPSAPQCPLYPGQKFTFSFREKGKWTRRTVTEAEWNNEAYGERTVSVGDKVRLGEVSKTEPKPNRKTDPPPTDAGDRPGPSSPGSPPAHPPADNHGTPLDYTQQEHWQVIARAELLGIDASSVKTIEELTQLIDKTPKSVKLAARVT